MSVARFHSISKINPSIHNVPQLTVAQFKVDPSIHNVPHRRGQFQITVICEVKAIKENSILSQISRESKRG